MAPAEGPAGPGSSRRGVARRLGGPDPDLGSRHWTSALALLLEPKTCTNGFDFNSGLKLKSQATLPALSRSTCELPCGPWSEQTGTSNGLGSGQEKRGMRNRNDTTKLGPLIRGDDLAHLLISSWRGAHKAGWAGPGWRGGGWGGTTKELAGPGLVGPYPWPSAFAGSLSDPSPSPLIGTGPRLLPPTIASQEPTGPGLGGPWRRGTSASR